MSFKSIAITAALVGGFTIGSIPTGGGTQIQNWNTNGYIAQQENGKTTISINKIPVVLQKNYDKLNSDLFQYLEEILNSKNFCPEIIIPPVPECPDPEQPEVTPPVPENPDPEQPEVTPTPEAPEENIQLSKEVRRVAELVNEERAKAGLPALTLSVEISNAALVRAKETVQSFSHTRPDGRNFSTALTDAGIRFTSSGENIAWGQKTPEAVMKAWMNSSGHRANILNKNYTQIGIGYHVTSSGTPYWTQLFLK